MNLKSRFKKNICSISIAFLRGLFAMSSIFTCPDLIAFHLSHVFTSGIRHDYLLNGYRIPSQGENVSINQWHINSRCIFYVGYISPVKVIILNYLVILSRKHSWKLFLLMLYCSMLYILLSPLELQLIMRAKEILIW